MKKHELESDVAVLFQMAMRVKADFLNGQVKLKNNPAYKARILQVKELVDSIANEVSPLIGRSM